MAKKKAAKKARKPANPRKLPQDERKPAPAAEETPKPPRTRQKRNKKAEPTGPAPPPGPERGGANNVRDSIKPTIPEMSARRYGRVWWEAYFDRFSTHGSQGVAALEAGVTPSAVRKCRKTHAEFKEREDEARLLAAHRLAREAHRRAVEGWQEPVFGRDSGEYAGTVIVGEITRYDSGLLKLMLQATHPDYTPRKEITLKKKKMQRQQGEKPFDGVRAKIMARAEALQAEPETN